jgi:sucrose phosphorylase
MQSEYASLFIDWLKFWGGEPKEEDVKKIYTRKPQRPVREVKHKDGSTSFVWNTFSPEQVDIDAFSEAGRTYIKRELGALMDRSALIMAFITTYLH